jgi:hypothetical protein
MSTFFHRGANLLARGGAVRHRHHASRAAVRNVAPSGRALAATGLAVACFGASFSATSTHCEEPIVDQKKKATMLNAYANAVCADSSLYQKFLPDAFEKEIYHTIVTLAVEAFSESVAELNGNTDFLQHMIQFDIADSACDDSNLVHRSLHMRKEDLRW